MKSLVISLLLFGLIIALVLTNGIITDRTLKDFDQLANTATEQDTTAIREHLDKVELRLMLGVCDSELDKIDSTVAELESSVGSYNFEIIKSRLIREIAQLRRRLGFNIESII